MTVPRTNLGLSPDASTVPPERNNLLLRNYILEVSRGFSQVHPFNGLGRFESVLRYEKETLKSCAVTLKQFGVP